MRHSLQLSTSRSPSRAPSRRWRQLAFALSMVVASVIGVAQPHAAESAVAEAGAPHQSRPPRSAIGINIGEVNYYTEQVVFLDLMKQSYDWGLFSNGRPPETDADGWPLALAPGHGAGFNTHIAAPGRYVILYEGDGEFNVSDGGRPLSGKPGRIEIQLDGPTAAFRMTRTNPANPIRNIRIVPIEHEHDYEKVIFHPRFIELVKPFGTLRFLNFLRINGSKLAHWKDRPKTTDWAQGTEKGVALEYAISLCNQVRADCWILIPHMADDDYVRNAARLVRDKLDPALRVYVEYSNEIWNYEQGDWIQQAGERAGMKAEWDTRLRYQARRSKEIFQIFGEVIQPERLVRVLAGQRWDVRLRTVLDFEDAYKQADAIAIAPYFCGTLGYDENAPLLRTLNSKQIAQLCLDDVDVIRKELQEFSALAKEYHLPLIAYEAGQHLVTGGGLHTDTALQQKLDEANRDPVMGQAYERYLETWREGGGENMVLFEFVRASSFWGRWGLLETMAKGVEQTPKYKATLEFMKRHQPWWGAAQEQN